MSSGTSCEEIYHAHLTMTRNKRPLVVIVKGGLVIEATLVPGHVELWTSYASDGFPISQMVLPFEAFDEILELVITSGRTC